MDRSTETARVSLPGESDRLVRVLAISASLALLLLIGIVLAGWTDSFDRAAVLALRQTGDPTRPLGPVGLTHLVIDITGLGSSLALGLLTAFVTAYLVIIGRGRRAAFLLASAVGGWCLFNLLKIAVARPRPDSALHLVQASDYSFPSGHATDSSATFLALSLLVGAAGVSPAVRRYGFIVALILIVLVGASRIYLGVHYPTDVLGGWCCGVAWVLTCWIVIERRDWKGSRQ